MNGRVRLFSFAREKSVQAGICESVGGQAEKKKEEDKRASVVVAPLASALNVVHSYSLIHAPARLAWEIRTWLQNSRRIEVDQVLSVCE